MSGCIGWWKAADRYINIQSVLSADEWLAWTERYQDGPFSPLKDHEVKWHQRRTDRIVGPSPEHRSTRQKQIFAVQRSSKREGNFVIQKLWLRLHILNVDCNILKEGKEMIYLFCEQETVRDVKLFHGSGCQSYQCPCRVRAAASE